MTDNEIENTSNSTLGHFDEILSTTGMKNKLKPATNRKSLNRPLLCRNTPRTPSRPRGVVQTGPRDKGAKSATSLRRTLRASKEPGSEIYPRSRFLKTIARKKLDIFLNWFFLWKTYVTTFCICGFSALERGGRVGRLHVQSTIEIRCNMDVKGVKEL